MCTIAREAYHFCRFSMLALESSGSCSSGGGGGSGPSPVHTCSAGSGEPAPGTAPLLLAVPGDDAAVVEVWCCACRQRVAEFRGEAAGRKLGMVMSLALYQTPAAPQAGAVAAAAVAEGSASGGGNDASGRSSSSSSSSSSARGGVFLAAGYEEGSLVVWDVAAPAGAAPAAQRRLHTEPMMALALDPGGASGVCGAAESKLVCFRVDHSAGEIRVTQSIDLRKEGIGDAAVRPDGRLLVSAGWDGRVRVYKRSSGRALAVLKARPGLGVLPALLWLCSAVPHARLPGCLDAVSQGLCDGGAVQRAVDVPGQRLPGRDHSPLGHLPASPRRPTAAADRAGRPDRW